MIFSGPVFKPRSGAKPKSAVILMHGVGADGENLLGLAPFMSVHFPETVFLSPNAPEQFDMYPAGYQWFSLVDRAPAKLLAGVKAVAPTVDKFIDEVLAEYNLSDDKLALLGFSQGTMTALYTGVRRAKKLAGIVGFSGALIAPELVAKDAKSKPDICLIHGEEDDVVPYAALSQAEDALRKAGFNIEDHSRPNLGHSIDPEGIEIACEFLKGRL